MKRPPKRTDIPARRNDNNKRKLCVSISEVEVELLQARVSYGGSSKHKRNPTIFGLEPFNGVRGDATLCDEHAGFQPLDMTRIPSLIERGLRAGLVGTNLWSIDDNGWIYEARVTNAVTSEYHGYPVRPTEAIAEPVFQRFSAWAEDKGDQKDKRAARNCASLYGFRNG